MLKFYWIIYLLFGVAFILATSPIIPEIYMRTEGVDIFEAKYQLRNVMLNLGWLVIFMAFPTFYISTKLIRPSLKNMKLNVLAWVFLAASGFCLLSIIAYFTLGLIAGAAILG